MAYPRVRVVLLTLGVTVGTVALAWAQACNCGRTGCQGSYPCNSNLCLTRGCACPPARPGETCAAKAPCPKCGAAGGLECRLRRSLRPGDAGSKQHQTSGGHKLERKAHTCASPAARCSSKLTHCRVGFACTLTAGHSGAHQANCPRCRQPVGPTK